MNKTNLKQGTLAWDNARSCRIGSSDVFDILRYYASAEELQNCGLSAEAVWAEKPYTTAWALYHKLLGDGIFQRKELPPELSEYGHAMEAYGRSRLKEGRRRRLKAGAVYASDRLIASLDISGVSEEVDVRPFDHGAGQVSAGKAFVAEQKTILPSVLKGGLPIKHIVQAQYQLTMTRADFFILQLMVLHRDTAFERGKITQMSPRKRAEYLANKITVTQLYFQDNPQLSRLITVCLERFFEAVDSLQEPTPFIAHDSLRNIIDSLRINSFYNNDLELPLELGAYVAAKAAAESAEESRKAVLQEIVETAKKYNASRFRSKDGTTASFSAAAAFLIKPPKETQRGEN